MSALDRAIAELKAAEDRHRHEALAAPQDPTSFGFGVAVGMYRGMLLSRSILERCMQESAPKGLERREHV